MAQSTSLGRRSQRNRKPIENYFAKSETTVGGVHTSTTSSTNTSIQSTPSSRVKPKRKVKDVQKGKNQVSPSKRSSKKYKTEGTRRDTGVESDDDAEKDRVVNVKDNARKQEGNVIDEDENESIGMDQEQDDEKVTSDNEEEEVVSSSSESEEEEDYVERSSASSRIKRSSPGSSTGKKKTVQIKEPLSNDNGDYDDLTPNNTGRKIQSHKTAEGGIKTKQIQTAVMAMAKKVLDPIEYSNRESSLTAALLYSSLASSYNGRRKNYQNNNKMKVKDVTSIARKVADSIKKNWNHAQVDLVNLIFRSVGCRYDHLLKYEIDLDELSDDDLSDIVEQLLDDMSDTAPECVLFCADPNGSFGNRPGGLARPKVAIKAYRRIYQDFWYEMGMSLLSDLYKRSSSDGDESSDNDKEEDPQSKGNNGVDVARNLINRLMDFVRVGVPDIRAAATLAIYKLAEALLHNTVQWNRKLDVAKRQYQSASRVSQASLKAKALKAQVDQLQQAIDGVEDIMKGNVMNVFLKRYRDNNEYIRSDSLHALSAFSLIRPDLYLSGMYLKYFGWLLSDKNENVRLAAVHGLLAPFRENRLREDSANVSKNKNNIIAEEPVDISGMSSVINKFLSRLADMVLDVDVTVQEGAMELLLYLVRYDFFSDVDNDNIWNQINLRAIATDTSPFVRRDALYFVMEQLQPFDTGPSTSDIDAVERIKALVEWISHILSDSEIPIENVRYELTDHLVASLRAMPEHKSLACNWSAILQCLKVDGISITPSRRTSRKSVADGDQRQDAIQQRVLLRFLVASADLEVHSLQDTSVPNSMTQVIDHDVLNIENERHASDTLASRKKRIRVTSTSHEELTLSLLRSLPALLVSFRSESPVLQNLTSLSRYLLPSVFNLSSRKKEFQALSSTLSNLLLEATDDTVLNNCALTLVTLARGDHSRKDDALFVLKETTTALKFRLYELLEDNARIKNDMDNEMTEDDREADHNVELLDNSNAIYFCMRRLRIIAKRWYLPDLMMDGSEADHDDMIEELFKKVLKHCSTELAQRQLPVIEDEDVDFIVPKVWTLLDEQVHTVVATSISDALDLLLSSASWKLRTYIDSKVSKETETESDEDDAGSLLLIMRNQIIQLVLLCYEQYVESEFADQVSISQLVFSTLVQEHAARLTGDLRMLFPKGWNSVKSKVLSDLALQQETALVGGLVRFVRSQEEKLRVGHEKTYNTDSVRKLLLPIARGLAGNWMEGNRKEAGAALSHIAGSGKEAHNLVQSFSRVCKKIHPVRLLESHMACLRQDFADWKAAQPDELEADRPSEEELAEYALAEKRSREKFESLENRAVRLSASLGVGTIKDKSLSPALAGFVREGVRFAFSAGIEGTEESFYTGDRLVFLLPLSRYLNWIRPIKGARSILKQFLDARERELRNDPDYDQLFDEEKGAIESFRKAGDLGLFLGDDIVPSKGNSDKASQSDIDSSKKSQVDIPSGTTQLSTASLGVVSRNNPRGGGSVASTSIQSKFSSSQSLSPLEEGDDEGNDELSALSPSPRRKVGPKIAIPDKDNESVAS